MTPEQQQILQTIHGAGRGLLHAELAREVVGSPSPSCREHIQGDLIWLMCLRRLKFLRSTDRYYLTPDGVRYVRGRKGSRPVAHHCPYSHWINGEASLKSSLLALDGEPVPSSLRNLDASKGPSRRRKREKQGNLTKREQQIVDALDTEMTADQVAEALNMKRPTIAVYLSKIQKKGVIDSRRVMGRRHYGRIDGSSRKIDEPQERQRDAI